MMMKKLLLTALALGAGLTACGEDKKADDKADEGKSSQTETPNAKLASYKIDGMT